MVIINGNIVLKFNKDIIIFNSNNYKQRILRYQLNQICEQYCLGIKIVLEHCMWYVQYETKKYIGRYPFIDNMRILRNKV